MTSITQRSMTDRETPVALNPLTTRIKWSGLLLLPPLTTTRECHAAAARVNPEMWTCPRNRSQVAAPPRKSHVPGDRALVQEARDGQGVGGALGHVQGLTALGKVILCVCQAIKDLLLEETLHLKFIHGCLNDALFLVTGQEEDPGQGHGEDPGHVPVEERVPGQGREVAHLLMELDSM